MTEADQNQLELDQVVIRLAVESDQPIIRQLFEEGLIEGHIPNNDTGADLENLMEGYFNDDGKSAFWVACWRNAIIAMIGVQMLAPNSAEMRRLRVRQGFRRKGVGTRLLEYALNFCQEHGYLKITLDVRIEREPAIKMFEKFGFVHSRSREFEGRKMLDFYLDLYRDPQQS